MSFRNTTQLKKGLVFVGMSGGVDSSVAALLLKREGYDVIGVFMRSWGDSTDDWRIGVNCAEKDAEDARRVAEKIGVPFYVWDFEEEYKKRVVDYMIAGYKRGLTPNPDVMCNREIKFGLFLDRALKMGADLVATGHYIRLGTSHSPLAAKGRNSEKYELFTAKDANKDQSYFLWTLTQNQLKHCLFPIGGYLKKDVREIARKAGLPTAEKKDSQGICFLGMVSMVDFLKNYISEKKGDVLISKRNGKDISYKKIGEHSGAHFYTIGQRQGIGNIKHEKGNQIHVPVYVAEKDVKKNVVIVAEGADNPAFLTKEVLISNVNVISPSQPKRHSHIPQNARMFERGGEIWARVRYRQPLAKAKLELGSGKKGKIIFEEPQKFVASGQSAVFYKKDSLDSFRMLGGGVIL